MKQQKQQLWLEIFPLLNGSSVLCYYQAEPKSVSDHTRLDHKTTSAEESVKL